MGEFVPREVERQVGAWQDEAREQLRRILERLDRLEGRRSGQTAEAVEVGRWDRGGRWGRGGLDGGWQDRDSWSLAAVPVYLPGPSTAEQQPFSSYGLPAAAAAVRIPYGLQQQPSWQYGQGGSSFGPYQGSFFQGPSYFPLFWRTCASKQFYQQPFLGLLSSSSSLEHPSGSSSLEHLLRPPHSPPCHSSLHRRSVQEVADKLTNVAVHNLSRRQLSEDELAGLALGLKFIPTPPSLDHEQLRQAVEQFQRRVRLAWQFRDSRRPVPRFRVPRPSWQPSSGPEEVEEYLAGVADRVEGLSELIGGPARPNVSRRVLGALQRFIDDGVVVWTGTRERLLEWVGAFGGLEQTIRLTHEISTSQFTLLDITFSKGEALAERRLSWTPRPSRSRSRVPVLSFLLRAPLSLQEGFILGELQRYILRESSSRGFRSIRSPSTLGCGRGGTRHFLAADLQQQLLRTTPGASCQVTGSGGGGEQEAQQRVLPLVLDFHPSVQQVPLG
ncbi:unnamed protein product [Closterium sp. NIES-65]|nr:unnamed protein product [Closterium sp. NIES-65]